MKKSTCLIVAVVVVFAMIFGGGMLALIGSMLPSTPTSPISNPPTAAPITKAQPTYTPLPTLTPYPTQKPLPTAVVPVLPPTETPDDTEALLAYINTQSQWALDCSVYLSQVGDVFGNYNSSKLWTQTALEVVDNAKYYCSTLGGYNNTPKLFAYAQSEIDAARADYGISFDYAHQGVLTLDVNTLDLAVTFMTQGNEHIQKATDEFARIREEINA